MLQVYFIFLVKRSAVFQLLHQLSKTAAGEILYSQKCVRVFIILSWKFINFNDAKLYTFRLPFIN
jgi:hypothetical protein